MEPSTLTMDKDQPQNMSPVGGGTKNGPHRFLLIGGIGMTITGIVLMVLFWPMIYVNELGYYTDLKSVPDNVEEGRTYYAHATVEKAFLSGSITVMILRTGGERVPMMAEGDFSSSHDVLLAIKITDIERYKEAQENTSQIDFSVDQWYEDMERSDSDTIALKYSAAQESFSDAGMDVWLEPIPTPMGQVSVSIIILGIIIILAGIVMTKRGKWRHEARLTYPLPYSMMWQPPPPLPYPTSPPYAPPPPNLTSTAPPYAPPTPYIPPYPSPPPSQSFSAPTSQEVRGGPRGRDIYMNNAKGR